MVKILEVHDVRRHGNFSYGVAETNIIGYSKPQIWSTQMPIGLVGIMPTERGADGLLAGLGMLQRWVYTVPKLIEDLRVDDNAKNLKASGVLGEEYVRLFRGNPFFMIYFIGRKEAEVYSIPSSVVLASGHNPETFTHDVLFYLAGRPAVAVSLEKGKEGHSEITDQEILSRINGKLKDKYGKPLSALKLKFTGNESGLVLPVNGIKQNLPKEDLEAITTASH